VIFDTHEKYIKDGKVLAHLGCQSRVFPGHLTDWSVWVGFWTSSPQQDVKYQLSYFIFFMEGVSQKPTQALKSVKDLGNMFDLNPNWSSTLPSLIYFSWDIYRDPTKDIFRSFNLLKCLSGYPHLKPTVGCQISTLIFEFCFVEGGLYKYIMKNI
jgi:hypothetical protein